MKTSTRYLSLAALMSMLVLVGASAPAAPNLNPTILPPNSKPYGASYGKWSDRWWQWAYSIPADTNPVIDPTGEFAAEGQSGPVWFLAGTFGGDAERTVTVPAGKGLFFPIYNYVWVNTPEFGDDPWSEEQEAFARAVLAWLVDLGTELACEIDGRPVENISAYRCQTPEDGEYMVTFPEDSVWLPAGTYGPSVSDGYYFMLAPLSAGQHTIHFHAAVPLFDWSLDVTYHITVVGGGQ